MRLGLILAGAIAVGLTVVAGGDSRAAARNARRTLLLEGTVTSIRNTDHRLTPWLVTVAVKKVISGQFAGSTFQFAVHSPARAGLS